MRRIWRAAPSICWSVISREYFTSAEASRFPGSNSRGLIFDKAGVTANLLPTNEREYRTTARRPKYSALENARLRVHGIAPMPPLGQAVEEYLEARKRFIQS